jgi:uncharacterized repeat protein (TIGR01451 family)
MTQFRSRGLRIAVLASIVVMVGLLSMRALSVHAQPSPCNGTPACENELAVDSLAGGSEDASAAHAIGPTFDISVRIRDVDTNYQGYGAIVKYSNTVLQFVPSDGAKLVVYTGLGGMTLNATALDTDVGGGFSTLEMGSGTSDLPIDDEGEAVIASFKCIAAGTSALTLVPPAGGVGNSTTLDASANVIPTGLTAGEIVCKNMADIVTVKDAPATALAGSTFDYVITAHNAGPNPVEYLSMGDNLPEVIPDDVGPDGIPGTADDSPATKEYQGYTLTVNGMPYPMCAFYPVFVHPVTHEVLLNVLMCNLSALGPLAPSTTAVLTITVKVPLFDAGKLNVNVGQAGSLVSGNDPDESNEADCALIQPPLAPANLGCAFTQVLPAKVSIEKVADKTTPYSEGDTIHWTVTATSEGPSPASDVEITDTADANQEIQGVDDTTGDMPCDTLVFDDSTVTCTAAGPLDVGEDIVLVIDALVVGSENTACVNAADVCWADPLCASDTDEDALESVLCFPPTVRMQKSVGDDPNVIVNESNLWLCEDNLNTPLVDECDDNGEGELVIFERVYNVVNDPDGAGAYEFQLKFDHKIFDVDIADADWLDSTGRDVTCSMSIITENWILFGCVSWGDEPGVTADDIMATITVKPEADLKYRMTPGNNNGLIRPLLDENCEIADPLGHPLELDLVDEWGRPLLAPGVVTGGLIEACDDFGITVRILEGDLNLDCSVDVQDQQAIAFRYGASFGVLLYDPWFDLEPWVKDFDIDIKDLQKVFGRDGSTCETPIPAQNPVAFPW